MPAKVDAEKCSGCGSCADVCPTEAITLKDDVAVVDVDECTDCASCVDECPEEAIEVEDQRRLGIEKFSKSTPLAAYFLFGVFLCFVGSGVDRLTKSGYNVKGKDIWGCGAGGARLLGMEEVAGSNPASSTK